MSQLFDNTTQALATSAQMRQLRHSIISSNVANAETPGYHAKKLDFEAALSRALRLENFGDPATSDGDRMAVGGGRISSVRPDIYENPEAAIANDGNTVDLERELAMLGENTILHKAALQLINKKLGAMKYAIEGGR